MRPYLISAVREYGKDIKEIAPKVVVDKVGDSSTIAQLQECMRAVVTDGTAKNIESPYYTIAGKTGTAQVADKGIKYSDGVYQGSFVGFFPAESPKYTIAVVIRTKPHSNAYYGGTIAAPVFRMIADKVFANNLGSWAGPLDSIARVGHHYVMAQKAPVKNYEILLNAIGKKANDEVHAGNEMAMLQDDSSSRMTIKQGKVFRNIMPDLKGMGLKDAVYLLESQGVQVQIQGRGRVQAQSVPAGTKLAKGQNITLQLS